MPPIKCRQVDTFTDRPFSGNPAAVCFLEEPADEGWMQNMAAEMNLSETAYVRPLDRGFELRWFTPTTEVALCGHATLASAHVLWSERMVEGDRPIPFQTQSGPLTCTRADGLIELDFPATPPESVETPAHLLDALGIQPSYVGKSRFDYLLAIDSEEALRALTPDFSQLAEVPTRGTIVTAPSDDDRFHFVSRFFAPAVGIDEDPVTGSAHCALAPFWRDRLGQTTLNAFQASSRGGTIRTRIDGDRVFLGGQAVTVWKGEIV